MQFEDAEQNTVFLPGVALPEVCQDTFPWVVAGSGFLGDLSQGWISGLAGFAGFARRLSALTEASITLAVGLVSVNWPTVHKLSKFYISAGCLGLVCRYYQHLPPVGGNRRRVRAAISEDRNYVTTTSNDCFNCGDGHGFGPPCSPTVMKRRWRVQLGPTCCWC